MSIFLCCAQNGCIVVGFWATSMSKKLICWEFGDVTITIIDDLLLTAGFKDLWDQYSGHKCYMSIYILVNSFFLEHLQEQISPCLIQNIDSSWGL